MINADEWQLDESRYRAFIRLFAQYQGALRSYIRSLLPSWDDVDEVMQEVSIAAWKKFESFDPNTNFGLWTAAIARYEVLHYRRSKARDRLVFDDDLMQVLADEGEEEFSQNESARRALEQCLDNLESQQRSLLLRAHEGSQTMKWMAEEIGMTPNALYKTLTRLRASLLRCMQERLSRQSSEGDRR